MDAEKIAEEVAQRVRDLIGDAQQRAEEVMRGAQEEARRVREDAEAEAEKIRIAAEAEARGRLDQVRKALEQVEAGLGGKPSPPKSNPKPKAEPETEEPEAPAPQPAPPDEPQSAVSTDELIEQLRAGDVSSTPEPESQTPASNNAPSDDAGAARLVAMKLALEGTSRDEARKQLAADYDVADLDALLDEVYAKAGK
jgi:hypothetical protein